MPAISRFFGITIYVYYDDHNPSHFHAVYGESEIIITIEDLAILSGYLPSRALGLVIEWASNHQEEFKRVWQQAINHQELQRIEPLK